MKPYTCVALIVALAGVLGACGSKGRETCEKFVERSMSCPDESREELSASERKQLAVMLGGMCEAAFDGDNAGSTGAEKKMVSEINATLRKKAECVAKAADCEAARACSGRD